MSIIGLDFGSHTASIALWFEEKNNIEVIADDLGSRTIPCAVAFRGEEEVITGQAAVAQQHKNPANTFEDVRSLLLNPEVSTVFVPNLNKDITVQELGSHFFRNIHNQIKQQVGKVVRDCVIAVPLSVTMDEGIKQRLQESAQAGGIRIKSFIHDAVASLMAYNQDDSSLSPSKTLVLDVGWSKTEISLWNISGGLLFPVKGKINTDISGAVFIKLLSEFCAKDFQRKSKTSCLDSSKSMTRLRKECEILMKTLSTGTEATIDLDSFFEGIDYSSKVTRARFEDLVGIPFMHLKNAIAELLSEASISSDAVCQVCISGGLSTMPKMLTTLKTLFPSATFPRGRLEPSDVPCIGAASQAKVLFQQVGFVRVFFLNKHISF